MLRKISDYFSRVIKVEEEFIKTEPQEDLHQAIKCEKLDVINNTLKREASFDIFLENPKEDPKRKIKEEILDEKPVKKIKMESPWDRNFKIEEEIIFIPFLDEEVKFEKISNFSNIKIENSKVLNLNVDNSKNLTEKVNNNTKTVQSAKKVAKSKRIVPKNPKKVKIEKISSHNKGPNLKPLKNGPNPKTVPENPPIKKDYKAKYRKRIFNCSRCSKKFDHPTKLKIHNCSLKCNFCDKQTTQLGHLITHIYRIHPEEVADLMRTCNICNQKFISQTNLDKHMKSKHADGEKEKYECDFCGKVFHYKMHVRQHLNVHKPNQNCELCGVELKVYSVNEHNRRFHSAENLVQCNVCGRVCKSKELLRVHKRIHDKKFSCEICGKKFTGPFQMRQHVRISHENERKFECESCGKKYTKKHHLKLHEKQQHEWIRRKPFKCEKCSYRTDTKSALTAHMLVHKRLEMKFAAMEDPIKCDKCFVYCRNKQSLREHTRNVHVDEKYQCDLCGMYLKKKHGMVGHIHKIHLKKVKN